MSNNLFNHHSKHIKTAFYLGLGAGIEYYDFAIFALFSEEISQTFFPHTQKLYAHIYTYFIFFFSYIIRPLGGYILGYIGDKYGRKKSFLCSVGILVGATFFMGILPGFSILGVYSTIMFIFLRCLQGLAVGGEIPLAIVFAVEYFPRRVGLAISIIFSFLCLGTLMTYVTYHTIAYMPFSADIFAYWRFAFIIGAFFSLGIYFFRSKILDIPQLISIPKKYVKEKKMIKKLVISIGLIAPIAMLMAQFFIFMPYYLSNFFSIKKEIISKILIIGNIVMLLGCILGGFLNDRKKKSKLYCIYLAFILCCAYFFYNSLKSNGVISSCLWGIYLILGMLASTYTVIVAHNFSPLYRCRGVGLAYNLAYILFSASIPALNLVLIHFWNDSRAPLVLLAISILIGWMSIFYVKKNDGVV